MEYAFLFDSALIIYCIKKIQFFYNFIFKICRNITCEEYVCSWEDDQCLELIIAKGIMKELSAQYKGFSWLHEN
ncbi:LOW QUALITY PROTEIN: hypothetical protein PNEG_04298 [Pneumocystis murina B123]|uniref:Uncharacterized protein n=1 Tax=Pneumocystis murina (strain B123) TaxID=1069680 RepID=A0A0W4ZX04_PNEMU|nr:LOW QUALITY PROTEIN: hypothetical protein PNEG_04298 [Pneumocystis murina B123]KTW32894.1 LOW QUALITY PROTEIN: hypothetical protein PNEG_04298 [Pneumocystis murina B123]